MSSRGISVSKRETVIQALVAKLETTEDNLPTTVKVLRPVQEVKPEDLEEGQTVLLLYAPTEVEDDSFGHSFQYRGMQLGVVIEGYMLARSLDRFEQAGNEVLAAVKAALLGGDQSLGGLVDAILYTEGGITYPEASTTVVQTLQAFGVLYSESNDDPYDLGD